MRKGVFCLGENYRPWWCELKWISTQITHFNFTNTKKQLLSTPARQCDALPIPRVVIDSSNLVLLQYCRPIVGCGVRDDPRSELNIHRCALCHLSRCGGMDSCQFKKNPNDRSTNHPPHCHATVILLLLLASKGIWEWRSISWQAFERSLLTPATIIMPRTSS